MVRIRGSLVKGILTSIKTLIAKFIPSDRLYLNGIHIDEDIDILVDGKIKEIKPSEFFNYRGIESVIFKDKTLVITSISRLPDMDVVLEQYLQGLLNLHTYHISTDKTLYFGESGISIFDGIANFTCEHELITDFLSPLLGLPQLDIKPSNDIGTLYGLTKNITGRFREEPVLAIPNNIWELKVVNSVIVITYKDNIHKLHYQRLKELKDEADIKARTEHREQWEADIYGEEFVGKQG